MQAKRHSIIRSISHVTHSEKYGHTINVLVVIALSIAVALYFYHINNIELLKRDYQIHAHAKATDVAHGVSNNMSMLHEDMEVVSRLLSAYDFGSYNKGIKRRDIDPRHTEAIIEIYRSMNVRTDVSELYITPIGFDPDKKDYATGLLQAPIITYDSIIKSKFISSDSDEFKEEVLEEIEIYEYREMKRHIEWFLANKRTYKSEDMDNYPSLDSAEVITCDNRFMNTSNLDESKRSGIVYSVPIYNKNGALTGILSSVILTNALRSWLPNDNYVLRNKNNDYTVLPINSDTCYLYLDSIIEMKKTPELIYSGVIPLRMGWNGWAIWASAPNSDFWKSDAVKLHYAIITTTSIVATLLLLTGFVFAKLQYSKKKLLEKMVREKTLTLIREVDAHKSTALSLKKAKEGLEILLKGRTTELKQTEKGLIEAVMKKELTDIKASDRESFITAIFNTVIDAIISINEKGIIQSCNKSAIEIFGYKQKELIGRNISILMPEPFASEHDNYLWQYMKSGKSKIIGTGRELVGKRKNGATFPIELGVGRLNLGSGTMFVGIIRDITERKNIEKELIHTRDMAMRSSSVKSEFIANISHEIRTPMNGILGFLQLLEDSELTDEQKEYVDIISGSANGMMTIVNDVFDYSRIESGKINIESSEFDIRNTIDSIVNFFSQRAHSEGLDIYHKIDTRIPDIVIGSPGRLRQVLVNLINNAIKFTTVGEITIKTSLIEEGGNESVIMLEVSDTGPGISEKDQKKIFESFVQVDGSITREHGGLGLGLAISRQLIEVMGGEIGVHSVPGKGSTFWFTLAFSKSTADEVQGFESEELTSLSALIIDDDHVSRDSHRKVLRESGIRCHSANNALVAMQDMNDAIQKGSPYDLVLIDIRNPNMDWIDVVKVIRKNPLIENINIVVLCSSGQRGHGEIAQELDVMVYLSRPFIEAQVVDAISTGLNRRKKGDMSLVTLHTLSEVHKHYEYKVLVVEDNRATQMLLNKTFIDIGQHPDIVESGEEALNATKHKIYDIVFMDIHLPGIDGLETTRLIRSSAEYKHIPIIALSSSMRDQDKEDCYKAGVDDIMVKPVIAQSLNEKISYWIEQKDNKKRTTA